ncbi:DEAD/DEAH box helicase [Roseomonas marmotae]|uniref:DEAD/DEAH box helicase n=1 Tax=Roseomonas marmotae TaxID=2768161 RepID=A0ABS3KDT4_9PROT|nr:DEAD/DEAH box helicase [Roseomonas marmotae]MBO1075624.1 DEAD/DEAH box helicase [Roseomonas marmotae]QTI80760.1 DEAD/DEAH box helicase [Roseomonas marmotae]
MPLPDALPGAVPLDGLPETPVTEALTEDQRQAAQEAASWDEHEEEEPRVVFADLGLSEQLLKGVEDAGYLHPTPIQEQAIPIVLMGRDVLGCAQTGTGKTASFVLPMMDILAGSRAKARMPRSLILEPTRELALQVAENFVKYGQHMKLNHALLIGGESMAEQTDALDKGVDVLIATPGRLLDLFDRGRVMLADCKVLVIDEADRMLDMGFIPDVERIVSMLPPLRQTLFFSATMAPEIRKLADAFLQNPKEITVAPPASVAATITTGLVLVPEHEKRHALRSLIRREKVQNALIFCNRKRDVDILYKSLSKHGFSVGALHGDLAQSVRFATLEKFKNNELQLLVCSDVAARGIDIGGLSHVFNFDLPFHAEDYVHRIGRTGRAGREGHAYSIATADDAKLLAAIEALTGREIPRMTIEGIEPVSEAELAEARESKGRGRGRSRAAKPEKPERGARPEKEGRGRRDEVARRGRRRDEEQPAPPRRHEEERAEPLAAAPAPAEAPPRPREDHRRHREDERARPPREERARPPREERVSRDRDDFRRDRRERDDLGPPVVGFGDAVPAFMLIPIPRAKRESRPAEADAA